MGGGGVGGVGGGVVEGGGGLDKDFNGDRVSEFSDLTHGHRGGQENIGERV